MGVKPLSTNIVIPAQAGILRGLGMQLYAGFTNFQCWTSTNRCKFQNVSTS